MKFTKSRGIGPLAGVGIIIAIAILAGVATYLYVDNYRKQINSSSQTQTYTFSTPDMSKCSVTKGWEVYAEPMGTLPMWQNATGLFVLLPNGGNHAFRVSNIQNITQVPQNPRLWENVTTYFAHGPVYCVSLLPNSQLPINKVKIIP